MADNNSNKLSSWQKAGSFSGWERIISAEALLVEEREAVQRSVAVCALADGTAGVLVGAMRGGQAWDLRPLLLESAAPSGSMALLRFSDPDLSLDRNKLEALMAVVKFSFGLKHKSGLLSCGENEGQIWIRRKFYRHTAADIYALGKPPSAVVPGVQLAQRLLNVLRVWHGGGIAHGHLCLENIAIEDQQPVLLDGGFQAASRLINTGLSGLAPELVKSGQVSLASDIFGLGLILQVLLGANLNPEQTSMLQAMQARDPRSRPKLEDVEKCLFPAPGGRRQDGRTSGPRVQSGVIKAGRVLGAGAVESVPAAFQEDVSKSGQISKAQDNQAREAELAQAAAKARQARYRPWLFFVFALVACAGVLYRYGALNFFPSVDARSEFYRELWESEDPDSMIKVANAALKEADQTARAVVVEDALRGHARKNVRNILLRSAFNPQWAKDLSAADRKVALSLALSQLVPVDGGQLLPLVDVHAGVILAVVGDLNLKYSEGQFGEIPLSKLAVLPRPFGWAFAELEKQEIRNLSVPAVQALCHILIGNLSPEVFEAFLPLEQPEAVILGRVLIVLPFVELYPDIQEYLYPVLTVRQDILARRLKWFELEKIAEWDKLKKSDKLWLAAGSKPSIDLSFEQYADLLKFPAATVRKEAQQRIMPLLPAAKRGEALGFLSGEKNKLNRYQVVSLLSALQLSGEPAYSFMARWFDTRPEPQSVLGILLARRKVAEGDPFNLEAARYLAAREWQVSLPELDLLADHQEALARALAYSKLDPCEPEELKTLKAAALKESNARIRGEIMRKIEEGHLNCLNEPLS